DKRTSSWTGVVPPTEYGPCQEFVGAAAQPYGKTVNQKPCPKPGPARANGKVVFATPPAGEIPDPDAPNPADSSGTLTMQTPSQGGPTPADMSRPGRERCQTTCTCC